MFGIEFAISKAEGNLNEEAYIAMKKLTTLLATIALALTLGAPVFAAPAPKKATTTATTKVKKAKKHHVRKHHRAKKANKANKA